MQRSQAVVPGSGHLCFVGLARSFFSEEGWEVFDRMAVIEIVFQGFMPLFVGLLLRSPRFASVAREAPPPREWRIIALSLDYLLWLKEIAKPLAAPTIILRPAVFPEMTPVPSQRGQT